MTRQVSITLVALPDGRWTWERINEDDTRTRWDGVPFDTEQRARSHATLEHHGCRMVFGTCPLQGKDLTPGTLIWVYADGTSWLWETEYGDVGATKSQEGAELDAIATLPKMDDLTFVYAKPPFIYTKKSRVSASDPLPVSAVEPTTEERSSTLKSTFSTVSESEPVRRILKPRMELLPILEQAVEKARKDLMTRLDASYAFGHELDDYERAAVDRANRERQEGIEELLAEIRQ